MVRVFWEHLVRSFEAIDLMPGDALDRMLHTAAGSAATLGYTGIAGAARRCRGELANPRRLPNAMAELHATLSEALRFEAPLLPAELASRCARLLGLGEQNMTDNANTPMLQAS